MNLENRIIERWQQWWKKNIVTPPNLSEETMRALIGIALEESQKEMWEPKTPTQIIQHCRDKGISVSEFLGASKLPKDKAIIAYLNGEITEGRLTRCLGGDRLEARRLVQEFTDKNKNYEAQHD